VRACVRVQFSLCTSPDHHSLAPATFNFTCFFTPVSTQGSSMFLFSTPIALRILLALSAGVQYHSSLKTLLIHRFCLCVVCICYMFALLPIARR